MIYETNTDIPIKREREHDRPCEEHSNTWMCLLEKARNKNLRIGDVCYLYLSGKGHYQVRYRLQVVDTSCARKDSSCWVIPFKADNDCYKLIPTSAMYEGKELSLDALEEIGINRYTQFKELDEYQEDFLSKYFM